MLVPPDKTVNCVLMDGGIGDHVGGSFIAIKYITTRYPWVKLLVWAPDAIVDIARNLLPGVTVYSYTDMESKGYNPDGTTIVTQWDGRTSPMRIHTADYAMLKLCDENPGIEHKGSLILNPKPIAVKKFGLPKKYVVFLTGYTVAVREFAPSTVNEVVNFVISKGYSPVFLGATEAKTGSAHTIKGQFNQEVDYSKGLSLIDKTSLLEAAKIMGNAKAVVGVDCGLMHVAGCTDVAIVGGYTNVLSDTRAPIRKGIKGWNWYPVDALDKGCIACQSTTNFLYGHSYTECVLKKNCSANLTPDKFIKHLQGIL